MSDLLVATCIREQLGRMAIMMMGANKLVGDCDFLQFNIGSNPQKVSKIRITLEPSDTYRVTFYGRGGVIKSEAKDIYVDALHRTIEQHTGLYLSLRAKTA